MPGDKSISHRALILAALARGRSAIVGLSPGEDVSRTAEAMRQLGATVRRSERDGEDLTLVEGGGLSEPGSVLDVGNSATGARLIAGMVARFGWLTVIQGDESVNSRPMDRVGEPLRAMGATVDGRAGGRYPPLAVRGGRLEGIDFQPPVASAQVKGAVLLAGLGAASETVVREPVTTRAHTEELLLARGARVEVEDSGPGRIVRLQPSEVAPLDVYVPGDPSQAAFWVVGACITPGSEVVVEDVYVGPARTGFLDVLGRMGASIEVEGRGPSTADIVARYSPLRATEIGSDEVPALVDEIPALAVAAAVADGTTSFRGASELRVKETDRIDAVVKGLAALGARAEPLADGMVITGPSELCGGRVTSNGDHRIAMALAVAGMVAREPTEVTGWDAVATSYPGFLEDLRRLTGAR